MNKEKRIEEIARDICAFCHNGLCLGEDRPCKLKCSVIKNARYLYKKGYRKASDVAREIFEEINELKKQYASGDIDGNTLYVRLYMLEKKYTEEEK